MITVKFDKATGRWRVVDHDGTMREAFKWEDLADLVRENAAAAFDALMERTDGEIRIAPFRVDDDEAIRRW